MKYLLITSYCLIISVSSLAHPGVGILEDSKGNVFFTDLTQVWKIDLTGKKVVVVPNVHTHELYLDENDNLFGEHLWYNGEAKNTWGYYVWRLSGDGKIEKVIPDTEGFRENYSFVRDHFGNMFWADRKSDCQKVIRQNSNRNANHTAECFHNIRFMRPTTGGELLVVDFQDVKKIGRQGQVKTVASQIADKTVFKSSISNQNSVMGIWDDDQGNIYAAVYSTREVKKFSLSVKEEVVFTCTFPWAPSGGMVSKKGELWVLESSVINSVRVVRISKEGTQKVY